MGSILSGQRESAANVLLGNLILDVSKESSIDGLLESFSSIRGLNLREVILEELLSFGSLGLLILSESLVSNLGNINLGEVNFSGSRQGSGLVDASNRNS